MEAIAYEVKRKTRKQIAYYAKYVRKQCNMQGPYTDILKLVEDLFYKIVPNYNFRIVGDEDKDIDMNGVLAYTEILNGKTTIYIREEIYDEALKDNGHARFTLAHEAGHVLLMHCKEDTILRRIDLHGETRDDIESENNPEWQADQFAAQLLVSPDLIKGLSVYDIMYKFKVSYTCACICKQTK